MKIYRTLGALWLLFCGLSASAWSAERVGLVLSGGGARGSAHIGVLKVLEELRVPVHVITGTSMGALVGGAYACGIPAAELQDRVVAIDWDDLFVDDPPREDWPMRRKRNADRPTWDFTIGERDGELRLPKGAIAGQKVQLFLADLVRNADGVSHYDQLPIPFRAIATNLEDGSMHVFESEPLALALRSSMSVPGLFAPMEQQERIFVDGGLVRNLPVDVARSLGVDRVIAVNLGSSYLKREDLGNIIGVAGQMVVILTEQNVERSLRELDPQRDLLISPDLGDIGAGDFHRAAEAIAAGEAAARAVADQLAGFAVGEAEYRAWRGAVAARVADRDWRVAQVRVEGLDYVNPGLFQDLQKQQSDQTLDRPALEDELQRIYAQGDFERISYRLESGGDDRAVLTVDALEKSWGPGYLSFGLGLAGDFQGDNRFGIRGTYTQKWLDRLGAEWTNELTIGNEPHLYSEYFQPLSLDHSGFVAPYLDWGTALISVFVGDQRGARYDFTRLRAGADLGTTLSNQAELRIGAFGGYGRVKLDTGDPELPVGSDTEYGVRASYLMDELDHAYAPKKGYRLFAGYEYLFASMSRDETYQRAMLNWISAHSWGKDSLVLKAKLGSSFGDHLPYYDKFALGGFLKLSGYANEQFRGDQLAMANLIYVHRIANLTPPIGRSVFAGGSLEFGRVWGLPNDRQGNPLFADKNRYGGSLFVGADTWLGPLYFAWGLSGELDSTFYFLIGHP
jgi:NTE family protein